MDGDRGGWEARGRLGAVLRCTQSAWRNRLDTGHGTRAGVRTENMPPISVTLDVLRLSGWSNANADCRFTPRHVVGDTGVVGGARACGGGGHKACTEGPTGHWALHAWGLRTANMRLMVVTLDVSRLSGWLNVDADCRIASRHVEGDTGGGRREGAWGWCAGACSVHGGTESILGRHTQGGFAPETCHSCP